MLCDINTTAYRQTSNWIWFPLVQRELDVWVTRQNAHRIRKQSAKILPSGGRPDHFYMDPTTYGGQQCLVPVDVDAIDHLLEQSAEGRSRMRYVDEDFEELAEAAYKDIGSPAIILQNAWFVFRAMIERLSDEHDSE